MQRLTRHFQWLALLLLAVAAGVLPGCKSNDDPSNEASRPWNAPKTWEHGLPGGMGERR